MSKERFDKLMKQQLESVRPAYEPRAWDRFQKRLPLVGFWPWLLHYGGWMLSSLMLTGWLVTLYTLHDNQQLLAQLAKAQEQTNRSASTQPDFTTSQPAARNSQRVDTVYIVKRTIVEHRHYYDPTSASLQSSPNEEIAQNDSTTSSTSSFVESTNALTKTHIRTGDQSVTKPKRSRLTDQAVTSKAGKRVSKVTFQPSGSLASTNSKQPSTPNSKTTTETLAASDRQASPVDLVSQPAIRTDSSTQQVAGPIQAGPRQAEQKPVTAPTPAPEQHAVQPVKQSRSAFRLSSLQPRVGIESMIMSNGLGIGPVIELFPTDNLGISIGLQAAQFRTENHHEPNEFNSATGQEFIDKYKAYLPAQYDRIEDIAIHTSLVSLPINLKYYVPLSRQWSLVFQTGSSFDLAAYQQVRYESFFQGSEQHHTFETNAKPNFFHSFMFGTGIQYRKSRISAQLSPYYLYDFRNITNMPTGSNFGLKASVWLGLFK